MHQKMNMDLLCHSEDKISLDDIVQAVHSAYEDKALPKYSSYFLA